MTESFKNIFCPSKEYIQEFNKRNLEIIEELKKDRGCATCDHLKHVVDLPGFVIGEESVCTVGLECDTVFFTVTNCPKYKEVSNDKILL